MKRAKTHSCCGCTSVEKGKKKKGKGSRCGGPKKWKKLSWVMRPLPPPPSAIEPKWRPPRGTNHLGPSLPPTPIFQVKAFLSRGIEASAGPCMVDTQRNQLSLTTHKICFRAWPGMKKSCKVYQKIILCLSTYFKLIC